MKKAILCSLLLTALASTHANASNYAECLLEKLPGAANQIVTSATVRICSKKYPAMFYGVEYGAGLSVFGFGYSNPDECTADKAKNTQSHSAAALIRSACMRLYTKEEPIDLSSAKPWDEFKPKASASHVEETPASIFSDLEVTESPADVTAKIEPIKTSLVKTPTAEELAKTIAADANKESKAGNSKDDSVVSMHAFAQGGDVIIEGKLNTVGDLDEQIAVSLKSIAVPELMSESCSALRKEGVSGSGLRFIYKYFNRNGVLIYSKIIDERECHAYEAARKIPTPSSAAKNETDQHYAAIYAAHPDADNIVKGSEFKAWISSLKSDWRQEYERVLKEGSTEQVIAMLRSYKASRRNTIGARLVSPVYDIQEQMQESQNKSCIFKGVMTKTDYDACGITPP